MSIPQGHVDVIAHLVYEALASIWQDKRSSVMSILVVLCYEYSSRFVHGKCFVVLCKSYGNEKMAINCIFFYQHCLRSSLCQRDLYDCFKLPWRYSNRNCGGSLFMPFMTSSTLILFGFQCFIHHHNLKSHYVGQCYWHVTKFISAAETQSL